MLLDKNRVSRVTKIIAIGVALTFILSYIPLVTDIFGTPNQQQQGQNPAMAQIAALEEAVKSNPKNASAWIELGNLYHDYQMRDKAIESYTKALELEPNNVDVRIDRAIDYYYSGQSDTATAEAIKGIEINPKHAKAYYNLGVFLGGQGKNDEAIKAFEQYVELEPKGEMVQQAKEQIKVLKTAAKVPAGGNQATGSGGITIETDKGDNANIIVNTEGGGGGITIK